MSTLTAEQALRELIAGNQRYFVAKPSHPRAGAEHRRAAARGQQPIAAVLGCADSRVPPEIIFDQGLGDLFVVRTAGHVVDDVALGSLEYAVEHLEVPLIVGLGHGKCGAVSSAAMDRAATGHLGAVLAAIQPAVTRARTQGGDVVANAIKANVALVVEALKSCPPVLAHAVAAGQLKVVGAFDDLDSGAVRLL